MPKGQFSKIKGAICNIPIDINNSLKVLPRNSTNRSIYFVKMKKKLSFKGHVFFQPVQPINIYEALLNLKLNNEPYSDIEIDLDGIPQELLNLIENDIESDVETTPNNLDEFRQPVVETFTSPLHYPVYALKLLEGRIKFLIVF